MQAKEHPAPIVITCLSFLSIIRMGIEDHWTGGEFILNWIIFSIILNLLYFFGNYFYKIYKYKKFNSDLIKINQYKIDYIANKIISSNSSCNLSKDNLLKTIKKLSKNEIDDIERMIYLHDVTIHVNSDGDLFFHKNSSIDNNFGKLEVDWEYKYDK